MENSYGVGITNRFSQFLNSDDDEVGDSTKTADHDKEPKKKGKMIAEKENRSKESVSGEVASLPPTKPSQTSAPQAQTHQQQSGGAGGRKGIRDSNAKTNANDISNRNNNRGGDRDGERGFRGPRPDREQRVSRQDDEREDRNNRRNMRDDGSRDSQRDGEFGGRGPRRGGGGYGGFRSGPRGGPRGGAVRKREFDRQSGSDKSGVKPIDKRDGAGSRNWGTYKDDIEETTGTVAPDEREEKADNSGQNATEEGVAPEVVPPEEEPAKLMTLDEYRAQQSSQPREKPKFNLRKAGEGEDQTQWNKMVLKKKEGKVEDEEPEEEEDEQKRGGRQKHVIDLNFQWSDSARRGIGNGPRGGRGPRGGGNAGMERGGGGSRGTWASKGYRPRGYDSRDGCIVSVFGDPGSSKSSTSSKS